MAADISRPSKAMARETLRIGGQEFRQDLDRNITLQLRIAGAVNLPHPSCTKGRQDFRWTEAEAWQEQHRDCRGL